MKAENQYKKGLWTEEEDMILMDYIRVHGRGQWNRIHKITGLKRGGKSCRLRWMNYLSPNVKRGDFSEEEDDLIIRLHKLLGNKWSLIAGRVPGRTDNQVKNHWNTHLCKKLGIKKESRKVVGSSKTHTTKVEATLKLSMDSSPMLLLDSEEVEVMMMSEVEDPLNDVGACNKELAESMDKHCVENLWFSNDPFNMNSPGFLEFLDGCPLDLFGQGL